MPPSRRDAAEAAFVRRRRGRNIALLIALLALVALFYFISLAKLSQHAPPPAVTPASHAPA